MLVCYKHIDGTFPGKQVINNAQEIIIPKVQAWWQNQNVSKYFDYGRTTLFINYRRLNSRQRQISASWTKNKRRGLLANQPRLLPGGQRGPVPGVPWDGSPVRVHHDLRGRLPARPPLRPPQQLGWDQARCSEVCEGHEVGFIFPSQSKIYSPLNERESADLIQ